MAMVSSMADLAICLDSLLRPRLWFCLPLEKGVVNSIGCIVYALHKVTFQEDI